MGRYLNLISVLALAVSFAGIASASDTGAVAPASVYAEQKFPSKYAVHQQMGPVCPHLPWLNLTKVRDMRRGQDGAIVMQAQDFATKLHSYAYFLPRIRVLDRMYDELRAANGAYSQYELGLRAEGIKEEKRFDGEGRRIENMDENPLDKARRPSYSPYNFQHGDRMLRVMPLLLKDGKLHFFNHETGATTPIKEIESYTDDNSFGLYVPKPESTAKGFVRENIYQWYDFEPCMLETMGISKNELTWQVAYTEKFAGFDQGFCLNAFKDYRMNAEYFYDVGTFQHMLFACGVKNDNTTFAEDDDSLETAAYREFRAALNKNPKNPWFSINKDDLFEYHLAEIFKNNSELKQKAMLSVGYYNDCWKYYQESLNLYDSDDKDARTQLIDKKHLLPGEDQMLAYMFSNQLRFLWAASISMDALVTVEELEENMGKEALQAARATGMRDEIILAAHAKKYNLDGGEFSFLDSWAEIKRALQEKGVNRDLVSFSSHGSVISFDDDLVRMQNHESRPTAEALGFEMWDSYYDKGLKPFYRAAGDESDLIRF